MSTRRSKTINESMVGEFRSSFEEKPVGLEEDFVKRLANR